MGELKTLYWDSCVFIAWLKNEPRAESELIGLKSCVDAIDRKTHNLATSALSSVEILEAEMPAGAEDQLQLFLTKSNIEIWPVDEEVIRLARKIRNHFKQLKTNGANTKVIKVPDAIHLATAIHYEVSELHTFDGDLLKLNGSVAGVPLVINKPGAAQSVL